MKKTLLASFLLLFVGMLAGCSIQDQDTGIANPASVYCEEHGGTLQLEESTWLCRFEDGSYCEEWAYYNNECQPGEIMYNTVDENIDTELPEGAKTSLTNEELEEVIDTHFPKGYAFSTYNSETSATSDGASTYPEDISHTLLLPEHATMASREVIASGIEDGMVYTLTKVFLQDDTEIEILYIVDPVTLNLVAANVENGNETTNYQFIY